MSEAEVAYRAAIDKLMVEPNPHHQALFAAGFEAGRIAATAKQRASANAIAAAERIYAAYPLKVGKQAALRTIAKVLMTVDAERLLGKTQEFAAAVSLWSPEDRQYVPHPATWYNRGSWEDDPAAWRRGKPIPASQFSRSY